MIRLPLYFFFSSVRNVLLVRNILFYLSILVCFSGFSLVAFGQVTKEILSDAGEERLRKEIYNTLNAVDTLVSRFPPGLRQRLHHNIQTQKKALATQSLLESTSDLLTLLEQQLNQSHMIELTQGKVNGQSVQYFSVGYLAFYYVTYDGQSAAIWDNKKKRWQPLNTSAIRHLQALWRMKKEYQPYDWISLPLQKKYVNEVLPLTLFHVPTAEGESLFSIKGSRLIGRQLSSIRQFIMASPLSLLLPQDAFLSEDIISVEYLQKIFIDLLALLKHSTQMTYVTLPADILAEGVAYERFLLVGPFTVIADDTFFVKDPNTGLLIEAEEQPGLGLSLQADALYYNKKNGLLPIDPLRGALLLKSGQAPDAVDYIEKSGLVAWGIYLTGVFGVMMALIRLGMVALTSWKISKQLKRSGDYRLDNPLGAMVVHSYYESPGRWINIMHETLAKEKALQQKREKRLIRIVLLVISTGGLLTFIAIVKAVILSMVSGPALAQALIPLTIGIALSIMLLASHALLAVCHRFLLLKLENASWNLLFKHKKCT